MIPGETISRCSLPDVTGHSRFRRLHTRYRRSGDNQLLVAYYEFRLLQTVLFIPRAKT